MALSRLSHDPSLLSGSHRLPAAVFYHCLLPFFAGRSFGNEQISPSREFSDRVTGPRIPCKYNNAIGSLEPECIGFVLPASLACMQGKMGVLDGGHCDIRVLVD